MGLFASSDPTVKQEKLITKEAKNDEKALKTAIKQVSSTEKEERNAFKAKHSATEAHEKAMKVEQKLREELTKLTAKHEAAVSHVKAMEKEVASKTETHQRAYDTSHKTKGDLEALQKENAGHDAERRRRLGQLHGTVAAAAGGDGVLRDEHGNPAHGPDARGVSPMQGSEVNSAVHSNLGSGVAPAAVGAGAGAVGAAGVGAVAHEQPQQVYQPPPQQAQQPQLPPRQGTSPVPAAAPALQTDAVSPASSAPQTQQFASPTSTNASAPGSGFPPPPSHPSTAGSAPGSAVASPAFTTGPSAAAAQVQTHPQAVETLQQTTSPVGTGAEHQVGFAGGVQQGTEGQRVVEAVKAM